MLRLLNYIYFVLLLAVVGRDASAFSMIGAFNTSWQTLRLGYQGVDGQIGGPMNLGEEYRWNAPLIYYAVDSGFLNYFGERGREEIDKAIKVLNDLPPMSDLNVDNYPLKSERSNYRAQALGIFDLKSFALATLIEEMGLGSPSRFVFTLRNRWIGPGGAPTNYLIVKRNFDPATLNPSSFINGDLWTFTTVIDEAVPGGSLVINGRVDPLAYGNPVADLNSGFSSFTVGSFFTGLTRDDVGGLRYIYRSSNRNVENPVTNAFGAAFGGGPILSTGGGQANGSPWEPFFISTNGSGTVGGGSPGSPWAPIVVNTNTTAPGGGTGGGGVITTPTNNFISTALRGGIDKVSFVRVDYDSLLGQFIAPVLDSFSDTFITNGGSFTQSLQRIITNPDILFTAGDLVQGDQGGPIFPLYARTSGWQNNATLNNRTAPGDAGPGTIQPSILITFGTFGPSFIAVWPNSLSESSSGRRVAWGSFDGTTNEPIVYPNGTSIEDIERLVLGQP
jgi:hypothetical protein